MDGDAVEMKQDISKTKKYLKVAYTKEELLDIGQDLARKHQEAAQLESDKKSVMDSFKSKATKLDAEIMSLSNDLSAQFHMENVLCDQIKDYSTGICTVVRTDTGEVVEERKLTDAELQMGLAIEDGLESVMEDVAEQVNNGALGPDVTATVKKGGQ